MVNREMPIQYVCFIDILGFKKFIEANEIKNPHKIFSFLNDYNEIANVLPKTCQAEFSKISILSDSMVISTLYRDGEGWPEFLDILTRVIQFFLESGFLFRGGISVGPMVNNVDEKGSILFGSALHDAYALESKVSTYPRIVAGDSFWGKKHKVNYVLNYALDFEDQEFPEHHFRKDADGLLVFNSLLNIGEATNFLDEKGIEQIKLLIQNGQKSEDLSIRRKFNWFLTQEFEFLLHTAKKVNGDYYVNEENYLKYCSDFGVAPIRYSSRGF